MYIFTKYGREDLPLGTYNLKFETRKRTAEEEGGWRRNVIISVICSS